MADMKTDFAGYRYTYKVELIDGTNKIIKAYTDEKAIDKALRDNGNEVLKVVSLEESKPKTIWIKKDSIEPQDLKTIELQKRVKLLEDLLQSSVQYNVYVRDSKNVKTFYESKFIENGEKRIVENIIKIMEKLEIIHNFYFTFGNEVNYPYSNSYLIVKATDRQEAIEKFDRKYPNPATDEVLNCTDYYDEDDWRLYAEDYYKKLTPSEIIY